MSEKFWELYYNAVKKQDWGQAKACLQRLAVIEKANPRVELKLGDIYQRMGKTVDAVSAYHRSAWLLKKQGFLHRAIALYKIILRIDPENEEALKLSRELMLEAEVSGQKSAWHFSAAAQSDEETPEEEKGLPLVPGEEEELQDRFVKPEPAASEADDAPQEETFYIPAVFNSLPPDEIIRLIEKASPRNYPSGYCIIAEGDSGDSVFLIKSGHAIVVTRMFGREIQLATLSPGDVFGEVAFLTGRPRTASVFASGSIEILEFNKPLLEEVFERYPEVLNKLHVFYEYRVRDTVEKVKSARKK